MSTDNDDNVESICYLRRCTTILYRIRIAWDKVLHVQGLYLCVGLCFLKWHVRISPLKRLYRKDEYECNVVIFRYGFVSPTNSVLFTKRMRRTHMGKAIQREHELRFPYTSYVQVALHRSFSKDRSRSRIPIIEIKLHREFKI